MKNVIKIILASGAMGIFLILAACGKDKGNSAVVGQCQMGQVYTQYGCLAQSYCQQGYGLYQNQCIPGTIGGGQQQCAIGQVYTQYGCLAQGQCQAGAGYYNGQCIPGTTGGQQGQCPVGQIFMNGMCQYANGGGGQQQCQPGMIYVAQLYTCLPTAGCPSGYANYYNMYCIPAGNGGQQCPPPTYLYNGQCIH